MTSDQSKTTLVIGASDNPERYSSLAANRVGSKGCPVVAIGRKPVKVADVAVETSKKDFPGIDTVTLYLSPGLQKEYYDYILSLRPRRIIFNPGAENSELAALARAQGIIPMEACT